MHDSIVVSFSDTINMQEQKFGFMGQKCINAYMHNMHTSDRTCNLHFWYSKLTGQLVVKVKI